MNVFLHPIQARRARRQRVSVEVCEATLRRWAADDRRVAEFMADNPDVAAKIEAMKVAL